MLKNRNKMRKPRVIMSKRGSLFSRSETDKAAQVLESFHSGYIRKILVDEGQEVPIKTVIAYIGDRKDRVDADAGGAKKEVVTAAAAKTIRKNIYINSTLEEDSVVVFDEINIGITTATEKGLVVPVLKNADRLSLPEISELRHSLVERTINGKQTPEDLSGGTFTITNLGMFGIESFKPVLNPGQAAILAAEKIIKTPVADDNGTVSVKL